MVKQKVAVRDARQQALRKALQEVAPGAGTASGRLRHVATNPDRERRRWLSGALRAEEADFIQGITATATLLREARDISGEPVYPADARHDLLAALERIGGWPSISELARALRVSKQAAREQVIGAARAGLLELLPDPRDRRSIQIGLTASGERELAVVRARQSNLVATLLTGLDARDMRLVAHVLRVIRKRLVVSSGKRG
jgi:DNA-binding MarR family transcriptional regulator